MNMMLIVPDTDIHQEGDTFLFSLGDTRIEMDSNSGQIKLSLGESSSTFHAKSIELVGTTVEITI